MPRKEGKGGKGRQYHYAFQQADGSKVDSRKDLQDWRAINSLTLL